MSSSPITTTTTTIVIVGAGFSGTTTALNLHSQTRLSGRRINIILIDRADSFGKGLAYATEDDNLVLNVPAGNMSAYADRPDDFLNFCHELDTALNSGSFMFRRLYGEYLQTRLTQADIVQPGVLTRLVDQVIQLKFDHSSAQFKLSLSSGGQLKADKVVLAFGHFAPRKLNEIVNAPDLDPAICVDNPWDVRALDRLPKDQDVLIVGTGHTAVDTLFRLVSAPAQRKIFMVSRHGHTPNGHRKAGEFVKLPSLSQQVEQTVRAVLAHQPTIRALCAAIRKISRQHSEESGNWRNVINSLRSMTPDIWSSLPLRERRRFLRHVVHHWDVLRHRLAPVAIRRLEGLIEAGRVEIIAGRIGQINTAGEAQVQLQVQLRGGAQMRKLQVGALVNCTGPNYDIHRVSNPLVRQLAADGLLRQDEVRIGFLVDDHYRCSDLPELYYIGPMLKASYWEAIAVPELRMHAVNLAKNILSE